MRALVTVLISLLLLTGAFSVCASAGEHGRCEPRGANNVTQFKDLSYNKTLLFTGPRIDTSLEIELPSKCRITSATLAVEGRQHSAMQTQHKDHNDVNNKAWYKDLSDNATSHSISDLTTGKGVNSYGTTDYTNVANDDSTWFSCSPINDPGYTYSLHEITVNKTGITYFEPYVVGYCFCKDGIGGYVNTIQVSIYNVTSGGWDWIGDDDYTITTSVFSDSRISKNFSSGFDHYIDSNDKVYLLVYTEEDLSLYGYTLFVNYVSINVTGVFSSYPTAPSLDISGDGDKEWSPSGEFKTKTTLNSAAIVSEFQQAVDAGTGPTVTIPLKVECGSIGALWFGDIDIGTYTNTGPVASSTIPNMAFPEDGSGNDLMNASQYFTDDNDADLRMVVEHRGGTTISGSLDPDGHHLDFSAPSNWFGREEFRVKAYDTGLDAQYNNGDDAYALSNWFNVTVTPSDDAPVIELINGTTLTSEPFLADAYEDQPFNLSVSASDIDGDAVEFTTNSTLFANSGGFVVGMPTQADVGVNYVNLTAKEINSSVLEANRLSAWHVIIITVHNTNDRPAITSFTPEGRPAIDYVKGSTILTCDEDSVANWSIAYMDVDGDKCTFSANWTNKRFSIVQASGNMTMAPVQADVGDHPVNITINDGVAKNYAVIIIRVNNVNDPPVAKPITYTGGVESLTVDLTTTAATDEDKDTLTYSWDFGDGSDDGSGLSATHEYAAPGNFTVTLTVSDGKAQDQVTKNITVTRTMTDDDTDDDDNVTDDDDNVTDDDVDDDTGDDDDNVTDDDTSSKGMSFLW